jgi:hypothetical protein
MTGIRRYDWNRREMTGIKEEWLIGMAGLPGK